MLKNKRNLKEGTIGQCSLRKGTISRAEVPQERP